MSRDESFLNTGLNSASVRSAVERKQLRQVERRQERSKLMPVAETIKELIRKERAKVCNIEGFVMGTAETDGSILNELQARKMHMEFLKSFEASIENLLRVPEVKNG